MQVLDKKNKISTWHHETHIGKPTRYYTVDEIIKLRPIFQQAETLWNALMSEYKGEDGSCITGEGIEVDILRPRCKYTRSIKIVRPRGFQGSCRIESSVKQVIKFLKDNGIVDCSYNPGRLD